MTQLFFLLHKIGLNFKQKVQNKSQVKTHMYVCAKHIAVFWYEDNNVMWHLGIVEEIMKENLRVSYLTQDDCKGVSWTFPETAEVLETSFEQILASEIVVKFSGTVQIRCKISDKTLFTKLNGVTKEKMVS